MIVDKIRNKKLYEIMGILLFDMLDKEKKNEILCENELFKILEYM